MFPNTKLVWEANNRKRLYAEGHARLATPLYALTFMALALAGVLGGQVNRLGYGRRIAAAAAAALVIRILGFGVQAAAGGSPWLNILQYLVPLAPFIFAIRILFRQRISRYVPLACDRDSLVKGGAVA